MMNENLKEDFLVAYKFFAKHFPCRTEGDFKKAIDDAMQLTKDKSKFRGKLLATCYDYLSEECADEKAREHCRVQR